MYKRPVALASLLLVFVLLLTACQPAQPITTPAPATAAPAAATPAPAQTAAAATAAPATAVPSAAPAPKETVTLTYFVGSLGDSVIQTFNDNLAYKKAQELTGIKLDFRHAAAGQQNEQLGVMMASRDLTDIVEFGGYRYPKGADALIEDGLAVRLNDLVAQSAPDFLKVLNSNPEFMRQAITDEGNIWQFCCISPFDEPAWRGISIRKDLLEKKGMALPASIQEFKDAMLYFKTLGMEAPLYYNPTGGGMDDGPLVSAWGVGPEWYRDKDASGKIVMKYGPMQDGFKDYLSEMSQWYKEGIIDKEGPARDGKTIEAMLVNGQFGAVLGAIGGYGPTLRARTSGIALDPTYDLYPIPNMPLVKGDQVHFRNFNYYNKGEPTIISTTSKHPDVAAQFLNFGYTDVGAELYNYGVEGVSYTKANGKNVWTDLITKSTEGSWVNIREKYKRHQGPYLRDYMAFPVTDFENLCMQEWSKADDAMTPPLLSLTAAESKRDGEIMSNVNTYRKEMLWKFVTGEEPLTKFDAFRDELKKMGIEESIKMRNDAFVRYENRQIK